MLEDAARFDASGLGPLGHFDAATCGRINAVERVCEGMALGGIARGAQVHVGALRALPADAANGTPAAAFAHDLRVSHADRTVVQNAQVEGILVATSVVRALPVVPLEKPYVN